MKRAAIALVLGCCVLAGTIVLPAQAQSDSGEIHIVVTDAQSSKPVELARVLLDGPVIASEMTARNGRVIFTDVPDGIYRARIVRRGYESFTSASFEVLDGRVVTVSFSLAPDNSGLKIIGRVAVKATATISTSSITQDSAQRRLSDDLAGALNKLSGVSVSTSSDDSDATQTISLEGHDASQTEMTLDGIPLNAPGSAGNLRMFASDLFMGASVHMGASLGGLAGSVNFTTLQPTLSWLSQGSVSTGTNGKYNYSLAESGSFGKLGIAVQTVYRVAPSWADGDVFLDASGQTYTHEGDLDSGGNLVKFRYEFGDSNSITGTFLNSAVNIGLVCLRMETPPALPCGYGPNNSMHSSIGMYSFTDDALIGATQLQASVFRTTSTNLFDGLDETVAALPDVPNPQITASPSPIGYSGLGHTQGFMLNATLPARARHTISVQAYGTTSTQATTPLVPEADFYYNGSQQTQYASLQATDTIRSSDKLSLIESAGLSGATGSAGATELASTAATWNPTAVDSYSASYAIGGVAATMGRSTILSSPTQLRFDCNGNVAYGQAPGQAPGRSSSISERIGYTRTLRGGNVSLTLYRQSQNDVLLPIYVDGTALESQLPFSYLHQVQYLYDSPAGCNRPDAAFEPQQLYFQTPVSGVQRLYEGAEAAGYVTLGPLVVQPYYNVNVSKANEIPAFYLNPYSITIPGSQMPNVPLQKAGIVFDYKAPNSALEWLADAQYVAKNNPNNLPAYTTFDAGVTAQLETGTLTLAASNVTNAYAGVFSSPAYAIAYETLGGYALPTTARPIAPRSVSVTYSVKFGQAVSNTRTASTFHAPHSGGRFAGGAGGPGGPGGPGGQRQSGFRHMFSPLPTSPPAHPFAVNDDPQTCSGDGAAKARQLSAELTAYAARIEAAKTPAGYPATMAVPLLTDATVVYHGLGATYALAIAPKGGFTLMRAVIGCMTLHLARADDVTARKLYAPATTLFMLPQLTFMPSVGLYIVARRAQPGQEQFRLYRLPVSPPSNPFAIRTDPSCTGDARNLATQAIAELRAYFAGTGKAPSWTIVVHTAKAGTWYELQPADASYVGALLQCARVATATQDEIIARGYAGTAVPNLDYAKALGLYFVRPNRPPGLGPRPSPSPSP